MVDLLHVLPEPLLSQLIEIIGANNRASIEEALRYDEHTAGGLMSKDILTVRVDVTLDVVARYLRLRGKIPTDADSLIVVDRQEHFQGVLPLIPIKK